MRVGQHCNVDVQFEKTVKIITVPDHNFLRSDLILRVSLDVDAVGLFIVGGDVSGTRAILVDELRVLVHHSYDVTFDVFLGNLILLSVLPSIVLRRGQVVRFVGAGARDDHSVLERKATRVFGGVGGKVLLSVGSLKVFIARVQRDQAFRVEGGLEVKCLHFIHGGPRNNFLKKAVEGRGVIESILVQVGVCVGQSCGVRLFL